MPVALRNADLLLKVRFAKQSQQYCHLSIVGFCQEKTGERAKVMLFWPLRENALRQIQEQALGDLLPSSTQAQLLDAVQQQPPHGSQCGVVDGVLDYNLGEPGLNPHFAVKARSVVQEKNVILS